MRRHFDTAHDWTGFLGGLVLGAAAMYVFDPDKGRRRRAVVGDRVASVALDARRALRAAGRDTAHRLTGLRARARHLLTDEPVPDDLQLIERVRARMGRLVSHPHAIQVGAYRGRVTLSGPVLRHEVPRLLDAIRTVWGVNAVDNRLVAHDDAASISSLQGGEHSEIDRPHDHWSPTARGVAILGGSALSLFGLAERSVIGVLFAAGGAALAVRAATNRPLFGPGSAQVHPRWLPIRVDEADAGREVLSPSTPASAG